MEKKSSLKKDQQVIRIRNMMPDRGGVFPSCDFFEGSVTVAGVASCVTEAGVAELGEPVD